MFIPLKMVLIGIDPYPHGLSSPTVVSFQVNKRAYQGDIVTADRQDVNKTNARAAKVPESNIIWWLFPCQTWQKYVEIMAFSPGHRGAEQARI